MWLVYSLNLISIGAGGLCSEDRTDKISGQPEHLMSSMAASGHRRLLPLGELSSSIALSHCDVTFFQSAAFTVSQMLLHIAVEAEGDFFIAYKKNWLLSITRLKQELEVCYVYIVLLYYNYYDTLLTKCFWITVRSGQNIVYYTILLYVTTILLYSLLWVWFWFIIRLKHYIQLTKKTNLWKPKSERVVQSHHNYLRYAQNWFTGLTFTIMLVMVQFRQKLRNVLRSFEMVGLARSQVLKGKMSLECCFICERVGSLKFYFESFSNY